MLLMRVQKLKPATFVFHLKLNSLGLTIPGITSYSGSPITRA
jgi:hypothetical protein